MEIWKNIEGFEGIYEISNLGNVKSLKKGIILKPNINRSGYFYVTLCKNKLKHTKKNHQLVAIAFLNHTPDGYKFLINHKNFIRSDNRLENLEIVTSRENSNKKHLKSSSNFTGVSWNKQKSKWVSNIYINGKQYFLGYFVSEIEASNAYENKVKELNNNGQVILK